MALPVPSTRGLPALGPPDWRPQGGGGADDRLVVVVDLADGTQRRWAEDEPDVANILADLTFGTMMPGGFKDLSCSLLRLLAQDGDERLFDTIRVLADGGKTLVWEGRIQQMPRSTDAGGRVTPAAVGWSAHLEDDPTFRQIYIDRDGSRWASPSLDRRVAIAAQWKPFVGSTGWHNGRGPTLEISTPAYAWSSAAGRPLIALSYDAGPGLKVATVGGRFSREGFASSGNWEFILACADNSTLTAGVESFPTFNGGTESGTLNRTAAAPHRYWEWRADFPTAPAGSTDAPDYGYRVYGFFAIGDHGLPTPGGAGTLPDGNDVGGVLASDVLAHALGRAAPLLRFATGADGTIRPTDFPIAHLTFVEPSTAADVIQRVNGFHRWDWAVWERRTFYFAPPGTFGRTWVTSTEDGLELNLEGDIADTVYTAVVVSYQDGTGVTHTVGAPGTTAETFDARLASTDPGNPAALHGIARPAKLEATTPVTADGAATLGALWLAEQARATRRGSATKAGTVTDEHGHVFPTWAIRAGDYLRVADRPGDPDRRIIETSYSRANRASTMTLDNTAPMAEAVLERLAASVGVALG